MVNKIYGRLATTLVPYLMSVHIGTRPIWLVRAGATHPQQSSSATRRGRANKGRCLTRMFSSPEIHYNVEEDEQPAPPNQLQPAPPNQLQPPNQKKHQKAQLALDMSAAAQDMGGGRSCKCCVRDMNASSSHTAPAATRLPHALREREGIVLPRARGQGRGGREAGEGWSYRFSNLAPGGQNFANALSSFILKRSQEWYQESGVSLSTYPHPPNHTPLCGVFE
jgi:hypothetical protein